MSTSPSPFRSNILKAISKFLWGAKWKTQQNIKKSQQSYKSSIKKGTNSEWRFPKAILSNSFNFSMEMCLLGALAMSFMVLLLPKVYDKELWGRDISGTFFLFRGRKSWKARCYQVFLMTINRKGCCSKSSCLFHAVKHQFSQRMLLRHCIPCVSHGWGADQESGQFSALASLYKFKQIMTTLSQPSHDTEIRCGLELTS